MIKNYIWQIIKKNFIFYLIKTCLYIKNKYMFQILINLMYLIYNKMFLKNSQNKKFFIKT